MLSAHKGEGVTGVILAGGRSVRMGSDKALLPVAGRPCIEWVSQVLSEVCNKVIIVANSSAYDYLGYPVYRDMIPELGPLGGISTGLTLSESEDNLILPCDMPFVSAPFLKYILDSRHGYEVVVPVEGGRVSPLSGYYARGTRHRLFEFLKSGDLAVKALIGRFRSKLLEINESLPFYEKRLLFNLNSRADLEVISAESRI